MQCWKPVRTGITRTRLCKWHSVPVPGCVAVPDNQRRAIRSRGYAGLTPASSRHLCASAGSRPSHWDEDRDREPAKPSPEPDSDLSSWIRRVLSVEQEHSSKVNEIRQFWVANEASHRAGVSTDGTGDAWSWVSMMKAAGERPVPLRNISFYLAYSTSLTASVSYLGNHWVDHASTIAEYIMTHSIFFEAYTGFMATALFLTLSFRLNRTADRWWSARTHFGKLTADVRGLVHTAQLSISNKPIACEIGLLSFAYIRAVEFYLRQEADATYIKAFTPLLAPKELDSLLAHPHRPFYFAERLTRRLSDAYDAGHVKNVRLLVSMHAAVQSMICETELLTRIAVCPEPWAFQKLLRLTAQLWLGILPVAMLPSLQLGTPVFCSVMGFVVYKLDDIAVELKSPFHHRRNDLGLCLLNDKLQQDLLIGILAYIDWEPKNVALVRPAN